MSQLTALLGRPENDLIYRLLMDAPLAIACVDQSGDIAFSNGAFKALLNLPEQDQTLHVSDVFSSIDERRWGRFCDLLSDEENLKSFELLGPAKAASRQVEISLQRLSDRGRQWVALIVHGDEPWEQQEGIQLLQNEVLQAVASGKPLHSSMDILCRRVESLAPEVICTVLLVDTDGKIHPCAAPSLPAEFGQAIEGESIGPAAGSCGTSAWRGEAVEVTDIATDPLWSTYKALALPLGLAACWSSPIKLRDGRVAATFALYYREKRSASEFHRKMVSACVHLCSLAIEHEHAEQHIHQLVFHDRLTGLPNLNLLKDRAQRALQATVYSGEPLTMMFLDLDHFKTVNESLGHQAGDRLLQEVARRLQSCIAAEDTLARLGGDEFVLLLSDTGAQKARALAEHLQVRLSDVIEGEATPFSMTASIGISIAPEDAIDFEMLHRNADIALYQAKAAGRNAIRFYQSHMNDAAQQHLIIASALRRAVSEQQLDVYYQPKIALDTGRLMGVEALVRWVDPELGSLPPDRFIPVAEETGLIAALDSYVMEKACRQLVSWQAQGVPVTSVAVNLSATEFRGGDIYQRIKSLVERLAIKPGMLTLEITESLMMEPGSDIHDELIRIRELGVGLSIDDFGTGFSSLSYLKRFPVTELKLDRSFVNDLGHDASDRALARAVIQLGATFGLQVVAEGVETRNQADILSQIGCTLAQGYYFAHPMPADQFEHWLAGDGQDYIE